MERTFRELSSDEIKQIEYEFSHITNFKEFFIRYDGIAKAGREIVISLFRRYRCEAGCEVCYIRDRWVDKAGNDYFSKYAQASITGELENRLLYTFDHFQTVSTVDDLHYIKRSYPELFEFYKRHAHRMNLSSMTDMALIQQTPIVLNDLTFDSMHNTTVSDTFVKNPAVLKTITRNLEALNEKYPIVKLRFILSTDPTMDRSNVIKLIRWAKDKGIYTAGTNDNQGDWFFPNELLGMFDHTESAYVTADKELHQIYTEVTHLMLDKWMMSYYQSTQDEDLAFYTLDSTFKPDVWLESLLREKLRQYDRSRKVLTRDDNNANYFDFFQYAADNVVVNVGWNFIPKVMINHQCTNFYSRLISNGYTNTPMGLVRTSALADHEAIVPIYRFKS